ncbi:hypothetical protein [Sporolactobacillus spathodeae]|uniref:Na+/melibiose symporter-like transporter n=1 Tax=Sporolactobacillus spathodeae TaxID=1465502 RepID=A0ABS2Q7Y2_9BACL|nr:hypothetical protein [Sporolactobacillus spathodeae]MBM7657716.1 Na+/melibiose symporter-like transporter [Sporolactobacillus spathodeae]
MIESIIYLILGLLVLIAGFLELKKELSEKRNKSDTRKMSESEAKDELLRILDSGNLFFLVGIALLIQLLLHFRNFQAIYFFQAFLTGMGIQSLFIILKFTNRKFLIYEVSTVIIVTLLLYVA